MSAERYSSHSERTYSQEITSLERYDRVQIQYPTPQEIRRALRNH